MTRRTTVGVLAGAIALVAAIGVGCGHPHGRPDPERMERRTAAVLDDVLDDLDATDDQRTRLQGIRARLLGEAGGLFADREATHAEVLAQLGAATPDAARLHALVDAKIEAYRKLGHDAVDGFVEAHGVLTPAQRAELEKKLRRHLDDR